VLFCGIIVFNILGECLVRAPLAIVSHRNYVKKFIFPIEILPISIVGSALAHFLISLGVLLAGMLALGKTPPQHILLLPLILLPLLLLCLGLSWFISMMGVYLRDMAHAMPFVAQILFFLTPIVYPLSAVPVIMQPAFKLNILAVIVEQARNVILFGGPMDWGAWSIVSLFASVICAFGYATFMHGKNVFADVL
jgi:lipopolysaccharide transport system permease protein